MERGSARRSSLKGLTREGRRQSDEHWNRFAKATLGTLLRERERGGAHMGFSETI